MTDVPTTTATPPVVQLQGAERHFTGRRGPIGRLLRRSDTSVRAVDGVSLDIGPGEIVGLIGESGSGKSTLGELITKLQSPTGGAIRYSGADVSSLGRGGLRSFRREVQMVFQDPYSTLNPKYRIGRTLIEPLTVHRIGDRAERHERARTALEQAGLSPADEYMDRWPSELSGGQRQRVAIARALVLEPKLLVADEPVSMLDVSVQGAILNLLKELRERLGLSILFVSHDLSTVRYLCDRIAIMYLGVVVECGPTEVLMEHAQHPYTRALLHAVPEVGQPDDVVRELPVADAGGAPPPDACRFAPRCRHADADCTASEPELRDLGGGHQLRCVHPQQRAVWA